MCHRRSHAFRLQDSITTNAWLSLPTKVVRSEEESLQCLGKTVFEPMAGNELLQDPQWCSSGVG
jgi:hypothetical protein